MNRKHRFYSDNENKELIDEINASNGPIREALARLDISKSTYYDWKNTAEIRKGLHAPTFRPPSVERRSLLCAVISQGFDHSTAHYARYSLSNSIENSIASSSQNGQTISVRYPFFTRILRTYGLLATGACILNDGSFSCPLSLISVSLRRSNRRVYPMPHSFVE